MALKGVRVDKEQFAQVLLSRFMSMSFENKYELISFLCLADSELRGLENHTDSQEFQEWSDTLKELIFPETIGELKFGNLPKKREVSEDDD